MFLLRDVVFGGSYSSINLLGFMKWFDRSFDFDLPDWMAPNLIERLRGTPARLERRLDGVESRTLTNKQGTAWSIQEQVGHLLDLEPLWLGRVDDIFESEEEMRPADLDNRKTHEARHNERPLVFLLSEFRGHREELIRRLDSCSTEDFSRMALHPRLKQPMRLIDLMEFVAEHDDHHLATITALLR